MSHHKPKLLRTKWITAALAAFFAFLTATAIGIFTPPQHQPVAAQSNLNNRVEVLETRTTQNIRAISSLRTDVRALKTAVAAIPTTPPTPTPTPTPEPSANVLVVTIQRGNVRSGPGTNYEVIGSVQEGDVLEGPFDEQNGWYEFCCINTKPAWISATLVNVTSRKDLTLWDSFRSQAVEVTGEDLLRNIDDHEGSVVYFKAKVFQSLEDGALASLDNTPRQFMVVKLLHDHSDLRLLDQDRIEFVAQVLGPYTYQTAGSGVSTVPALHVIAVRLLD